ncbi:MAG TPA: PilZ domain-containing protein [Thermoanaerobaculia bacterium]|nr:PilZ domain-containing protein [Thermoanaerobaculia bacterium]
MKPHDERRKFQRLELASPLAGRFDEMAIRLFDISLSGAFIEHGAPIEMGATGILEFEWKGSALRFECRVVRSGQRTADGNVSMLFSGLDVTSALGDSDVRLREMIAENITRIMAAREANAYGLREMNRLDGDRTLTALGSVRRALQEGFVNCRLVDGVWKDSVALLPDQPRDGFAVAAWEAEDQVGRLKEAYEKADDEGRDFLRMLAELSISEARGIPPRQS